MEQFIRVWDHKRGLDRFDHFLKDAHIQSFFVANLKLLENVYKATFRHLCLAGIAHKPRCIVSLAHGPELCALLGRIIQGGAGRVATPQFRMIYAASAIAGQVAAAGLGTILRSHVWKPLSMITKPYVAPDPGSSVEVSYLIGAGRAHTALAFEGQHTALLRRSRAVAIPTQAASWYLFNVTLTPNLSLLIKPDALATVLVSTLESKLINPEGPPFEEERYRNHWHPKTDWVLNEERIIDVPNYQLIWIEVIDPHGPFSIRIDWGEDSLADNSMMQHRVIQWPDNRGKDE